MRATPSSTADRVPRFREELRRVNWSKEGSEAVLAIAVVMGLWPFRIASATWPSFEATLSGSSGPPDRLYDPASNEQSPGLFVVEPVNAPQHHPLQHTKGPGGPFGMLERVMGIEPTSKAWEAFVLPLNYTRVLGLILQNPLSILK